MNPEKNGTVESIERYLRPATFFLLAIAIGLSLVLHPGMAPVESGAGAVERMNRARSDLMFNLVVLQVVHMDSLKSSEDREFIRKAVLDQLKRLEEDASFRSPESEVQRRIILDYTSENISDLSKEALGPYREAFLGLYVKGILPPANDSLLSLPAARLALLKYYRTADPKKHEAMFAAAREEAEKVQSILLLGMAGFGFFTLLGLFLASRFFLRRPPPFFSRFLETFSPLRRSALLESAILYLFLIYPAGMVSVRFVPPALHLPFQFGYTILAGATAVWYFMSEVGAQTLWQTLWIPVVLGPPASDSSGATVPGGAGAQAAGGVSGQPDLAATVSDQPQVVLHSRPFPALREILFGLGAAAVFVPLVFLKTAAGVMIGDPALEFRFAGPAVLVADVHFWWIFGFAVGIVPIIEEIVFRNWLYGALRFRFSVFAAALMSAVFFAVLHPAGWWPFLLLLGTGLAFVREFRPGILAPIVAHASVNAVMLLTGAGLAMI